MRTFDCEILILGAGPAGLSAALAAARCTDTPGNSENSTPCILATRLSSNCIVAAIEGPVTMFALAWIKRSAPAVLGIAPLAETTET